VNQHYDRRRTGSLRHQEATGQVDVPGLKARLRYIEGDTPALQAIEADLAGIAL